MAMCPESKRLLMVNPLFQITDQSTEVTILMLNTINNNENIFLSIVTGKW